MKLNADLGEGQHWNSKNIAHALAPHIHIANISCNLHAGDEDHIKETVEICLKHGISLGAHPSYDDRVNFGRHSHSLSQEELKNLLVKQWEWLNRIVTSLGGQLTHFKAHGALYNDMVSNPEVFKTVQETVETLSSQLIHICSPFTSKVDGRFLNEGFIDRLYLEDGSLTPRSNVNAVHDRLEKVLSQIHTMKKNKVVTDSGKEIHLKVDTLCIHGDNPMLIEHIEKIVEAINED